MEPRHLLSLPADERVDRLLFSGRAELQEHAIDVATYQCPHCSAGAEFNTGTLRKAERYRGSPLPALNGMNYVRPFARLERGSGRLIFGARNAVARSELCLLPMVSSPWVRTIIVCLK